MRLKKQMETNKLRVAVNVAVYNEEEHLPFLLESLLSQSRMPDQIVIVDDGSTDATTEIIKRYANKNPTIKYLCQENAGPSAARNNAWKNSDADICFFTDGDCIPRRDWIEQMLKQFTDEKIGAVAGTYETSNPQYILARFVGLEIAWKYKDISGPVNVHGTYNLAVRKKILEEIGGFDAEFKTAEDADLTYKISDKYTIFFTPSSIVGHHHPETFWWYMKNQVTRGQDRMLLYKRHPNRMQGDSYTSSIIKYQVLAGGALLPSLIFFYPFFHLSFLIPVSLLLFSFLCALPSFSFIASRDLACALYGIPIQIARSVAWFIGLIKGIIKYNI